MGKTRWILPLAALVMLLAWAAVPARAEDAEAAKDDWTVLFYFCGSDLESENGYATGNLEEIQTVTYPDSYFSFYVSQYGVELDPDSIAKPGKVNILIETGGSSAWHAQDIGLDIAANALQRWRYNYYPFGGQDTDGPYDGYELMETLPLQSMAAPETLADFIRWGTRTCPAQKYALVLWDHGGGAGTGLIIDELFDDDMMYLYELRQALADGGAHFEAVVIDACLMANLETAWSLKDYANWMVASEEIVPGKGTAVGDWLQALINHADCDGEWLGRCVCDMTAVKYANQDDELGKTLLTWSLIDLSRIDDVVGSMKRFFDLMDDALRRYPSMAVSYTMLLYRAGEYGDGTQEMRDVMGVFLDPFTTNIMDLGLCNDILDALSGAVVYTVRGSGRSAARGLSFCYPVGFDSDELDIYARNFPMPEYLAYLDALTGWTAPETVYEQVGRLPEIDEIEEFQYPVFKRMTESGMPAVGFGDAPMNVNSVYYRLYRLDEETGQVVRLGRTECGTESAEDGMFLYRASDPMHWPSVDGTPFCMELVQSYGVQRLYNVPVQIGSRTCILRCGRTIFNEYSEEKPRTSEYEVFGVWDGYEENSELMNRSVRSLITLTGQEYQFLYPVDKKGGRTTYQASEPMTMYRALDVKEIPLPAGTYYLEYEVEDVFMRHRLLERIELHWDGREMTFPEGFAWEGTAE